MGFFDKLKGAVEVPVEEKKEEKPKQEKEKKKKTAKKMTADTAIETKEEAPLTGGQLTIDVYETDDEFVIQSTIAGVKAEDLDITIENDIVTIGGSRQKQTEEAGKKYYYQECYWGSFARQIILPEEVDGSKAEAAMKDGVLTLRIPKVRKIQKRKISVKQGE